MNIDLILYCIFAIPGLLFEMVNQLAKVFLSEMNSQSKSKDHGTFYFIWSIIIFSMGSSIYFVSLGYGWKIFMNTYSRFIILIPLSICLIIMGHLLRKQAIQQLGKWFTMTVRINDEQKLIESGWYGKMRHPSYTGVLMIFFGQGLLSNNCLILVGTSLPAILVFLYRIHVEEEELKVHFGSNYAEYTQRVPAKLIPNVF
jgi:protein-S-isoprenylcysteine O-methyltransferase Ste14